MREWGVSWRELDEWTDEQFALLYGHLLEARRREYASIRLAESANAGGVGGGGTGPGGKRVMSIGDFFAMAPKLGPVETIRKKGSGTNGH